MLITSPSGGEGDVASNAFMAVDNLMSIYFFKYYHLTLMAKVKLFPDTTESSFVLF